MSWIIAVYAIVAALTLSVSQAEVPEADVLAQTPTVSPSPSPVPRPPKPSYQAADYQVKLLNQINDYRRGQGLSSATMNPYVCNFASLRAQEISQEFSHRAFQFRLDGKSFPYPSYSLVTENIAMAEDENVIVNLWINSPSHADNMRRDTPYICVVRHGSYYAYQGWKP